MNAMDLVIELCDFHDIRKFVEEYHYSKSVNGVKISYCFCVKNNGNIVGAVIYGMLSTTAWKKFGTTEKEVIELRRLVLLDECGRNSESRVIGFTLRWLKKNVKTLKTVVSYADPNHGHIGTIYKASNFYYLGLSASDIGYMDKESGKIYHSRALRTKDVHGNYKPFVLRLREKLSLGLLEKIKLQGKHCFVYKLWKNT